ncbi:hypothetical protein [Streptomyces sp. YIM 132580]|uniref:hypothetical protein n=1 Tax=Streptomyces sp. YIM 132580 TaxID=2691958 RepID=UPI00136DF1E1|nr:hypothetical protein [Streptomyces sp. YIM 132580]MXG30381.1 hypothetical protein [Streptomyces sp. YIM 132580]
MTTTNPESVPATPVYTITVSVDGVASINGEQVTEEGLDPNAARVAALSEIMIKAALHGRPVRVLAKEADGSAWPLIVDVNGTVTTLETPHPAPPAPVPAQARPAASPHQEAARAQARPPQQPAAAELGSAPSAVPTEWAAPLPPQYGPAWADLVAQEKAGRLVEAIVTAAQLETVLAGTLGPLAPPTVNVMTVRAAFTVRRVEETEDWAETVELLVQTVQCRREAGAPEDETQRLISNAHATWMRLSAEDPEYAHETAEPVLVLLGDHPQNKRRAQAVIRLLERGAAA